MAEEALAEVEVAKVAKVDVQVGWGGAHLEEEAVEVWRAVKVGTVALRPGHMEAGWGVMGVMGVMGAGDWEASLVEAEAAVALLPGS